MIKRALRILVPVVVLAAGAWVVHRHFARQAARQEALLPPPSDTPGLSPEKADALQRIQKKRLEETLRAMEETRRLNERSAALQGDVLQPQSPVSDVQRTFKTLDEINRLNRLNRETREKQRASPLPARP